MFSANDMCTMRNKPRIVFSFFSLSQSSIPLVFVNAELNNNDSAVEMKHIHDKGKRIPAEKEGHGRIW